MKLRFRLLISLGLNLGFLGVLAYLLSTEPAPKRIAVLTKVITNNVRRVVAEKGIVPAKPAAPTPAFHWSRLESADYPIYMANLRGIGCPEATIREIILADINEEFTRRQKALLEPLPGRFWPLMALRNQPVDYETDKQLVSLAREREDLLKELLGANWQREELKAAGHRDRDESLLAYLPKQKQQSVIALQESLKDEGWSSRSKEFLDALEKLLTPEEFDEFKLRTSPAAHFLRENLRGFETSEDELRDLARLHQAFADHSLPPNASDPRFKPPPAKRDPPQQPLDEQIKQRLGEEKFAEYQRARDGDFWPVYDVAQRYDLPEEAAFKVYEAQKAAEAQAQRIRSNQKLSERQQAAALTAIRAETEKTVTETFGEKAYQTYKKYWSDWAQGLGP